MGKARVPSHIERILKLLMLSGRNNPNVNERAAARALTWGNSLRYSGALGFG